MRYIIIHSREPSAKLEAEDYVRQSKLTTSVDDYELVSVDDREGQNMISLYGVYSTPAALIVNSDTGAMIRQWQGELPPIGQFSSGAGI